jgi:hypothetical protein
MARWHSCNVLMPGSQVRQLWQFNASGDKFNLQRQESKLPSEPLPERLIAKDWHTLFQPKLNIAWLSAEKVFLRVVQLPKADFAETQSMVELQLEKLSPLPVAQIVWSFQVVPHVSLPGAGQELTPHATGELQTVIVIMVSRNHVEEYLGELEGQGYLADRLELPLLDELRATKVKEDGAWIFPGVGGHEGACMVAWWYGGVLQNLSILHLPAGEARAAAMQEQLAQIAWAGELDGWLTSEPKYHLVADQPSAQHWLPLFDLAQRVEVVPPLTPQELAALTARRVAVNGTGTNLLPPEYTTRYKQQFVDRLWMRGLFAVVMAYIAGVVIYFGFVQWASWRYGRIQDRAATLGVQYTNTVRLKEQLRVLQDTLELQYAALECYKSVADLLPPELTLNSLRFERGRKMTISGTAGTEDRSKVNEFWDALGKVEVRGQLLYSKVNAPDMRQQPGTQLWNWSLSSDLKRNDTSE